MLLLVAGMDAVGGTVGRVVSIGGHASDLALDEGRGVVYVANYTANRVEVVSASTGALQSSINVAAQPSSVALSPDGRYLVIGHFGAFQGGANNNGLTVLDLQTNARQTFVMGAPVFGVAFGIDGRALVATAAEFLLFEPSTGSTQTLGPISQLTTKSLPQPVANFPANIVAASMTTSGDGLFIFGTAAVGQGSSGSGANSTLEFTYNVTLQSVSAVLWTWSPPPGPRAISANYDGSVYMTAWAMQPRSGDITINQLNNQLGTFDIGTHVFDNARGRIYVQYAERSQGLSQSPTQTQQAPVLRVVDADNLAVRERLQLPENFAGKSVLNSDSSVMYGVSASGLLIVPVGDLTRVPRVLATKEDVVFRGNFCDRRVSSQEVTIYDPSGANTDFSLSVDTPGVTVSPSSGVTPATVRINVDPAAFQNQRGTVTASITLSSQRGANLPQPIRVLINNREPDQRGTIVNVGGTLVDLLADPQRDRFYVLRQNTNEVLVYDGTTQTQIATLRTYNTPTQLAVTFDRRWLLIGHDNSQLIRVYDLETLEESLPIRMPPGHYPRSIAATGRAILVASRVAGPEHKISKVDFVSRTATALPTLGVFENKIDPDTILIASPNGRSAMAASSNGTVYLYDANADTFTISRKDTESLSGAYAASSFDQYVIGTRVLNSSLVPVAQLETSTGRSSGFVFLDQGGFRTTAADAAAAGVIQRFVNSGELARATRLAEAPVLPVQSETSTGQGSGWRQIFTRTVQPLYSRQAIVALTTSGVTVLPWNYDAAVAAPRLERVTNAADGSAAMAPGSLISIYGTDLSPLNQATQQMPLPTALGESCLTVNGVPVPVIFVSPAQINGQLPFQVDGNVAMILRTPGGVSDTLNLTILPNAPGVFRNGVAGARNDVPAVYRQSNGLLVTESNPIRRGEMIQILLTGLGRTTPAVEAGVPAPGDPLAAAIVPPTVRIGGVQIPVEFAGLLPNTVGVYQLTARVSSLVPLGLDQPLVVSQGGSSTTVSVRVIE